MWYVLLDLSLGDQARGIHKHVRRIVVHAEHKTSHQRDVVAVKYLDHLSVAPRVIEPFVR